MAAVAHKILGYIFMHLLLAGMLPAGVSVAFAQQSPFDPVFSAEAAGIREEVRCYADRSLYVTEDVVRFSAFVRKISPEPAVPWSSVLYVELVSPRGNSLVRGKFPVRNGRASGEITLPAGMKSGNYYLRSYTRWMRNWGPESYHYLPLKVVNPVRSEVEDRIPDEESDIRFTLTPMRKASVEFRLHPEICKRGEEVSMELYLPEGPSAIRGSITVVSSTARPEPAELEAKPAGQTELDLLSDFQLSFLPDKFGPSISGSLITSGEGKTPFTGARVHLTLMGGQPDYFVCQPDALGRFSAALPFLDGKQELFIQARNKEGSPEEVRIDREFDQRHLNLPAASFELSEGDRRVVTIMARNQQLRKIYQNRETRPEKDSLRTLLSFYGQPSRSVDLDRFVLLPTLEEVFVNLVPDVTPVKRRKGTSLQIHSENPAFSMFDPLIMVDQVPIFDLEKFMAISPAKIRRIDVIDDVYVKGDMRYGGLINLHSREGDMAGIDLPENSFFIDYQTMNPPAGTVEDPASGKANMPDTRDTYLWQPDLFIQQGESLSLTFRAPDYPGKYTVQFRGLDQEGETVVAESLFNVLDSE